MPPRNAVADRVRILLDERALVPGDRLPSERELAAHLGVSRSSLREGLGRLADLGIIEARRGSGTYLAPLDLRDLTEARLRLEPYAARLAAERRDPRDLARLDDTLAELRASLGERVAFADADLRLHATIAEASRSLPVRVLLDAVADLLRHSRAVTAVDPDTRRATVVVLERLVQAIHAGDGPAAETAMREHLVHVVAALPGDGA
jgi:GntR family transcriptional repressor for pyruvate dehydrogenase complex